MSKEFVTLAWDDIHRVEDNRLVAGPHERSLTIDGVTYYWDFSDQNAAEFDQTMTRLMRCAHEHHKVSQPRKGIKATSTRDEDGEIVPIEGAKPLNLRVRPAAERAKSLAIREKSRREHVRSWGMANGLAKYRGILSVECQEAFCKEFGLDDINAPITQQALGAVSNG